jgi:hypothetical protein
MPDIDFAMTYPCYLLLTASGNPESIVVDGRTCVCLFTDEDLVKGFYRGKYGPSASDREFEVDAFLEYDGLIGTIREWEKEFADQGVFHIAIDPTPGKMTAYVEIQEFIAKLEK